MTIGGAARKQHYKNMSISVSIIEDNTGLQDSLVRLIDNSPGFRCSSQHATAESALKEISKVNPEVVLMDINLPGLNGVECVRRLKPLLPGTQIIMLTAYNKIELIYDALSAGATGYLLKQTKPDDLLAAIRDVHEGGSPINSSIARRIVQSFQKTAAVGGEVATLSPRESEVLDLLAKGYLYKEISEKLELSFSTVRTHVRHIYEKLHVRSRTEAVTKHLGQMRTPVSAEYTFPAPSKG
jgi:DNA-binding NarL/FixJ family response regulator